MTLVADTAAKLRGLRSYDNLLDLLDSPGFTYSDEQRSTADWPVNIREAVQGLRIAARHGSFLVFYAQVEDQHMLTWERQVVNRILSIDPHSLFVFTNPSEQVWHFVHVRYDERLERRKQLRRFVVDLTEARGSERLRTTAERLSRLAIPAGRSLSALEVQELCDGAFRISEVTKQFLSSFVRVVKALTPSMVQENPTLLADEREALRQAQLLMDRLVFLYFIQRKGWLNGENDYLYQRFRQRYQEDPQADTFYREHLLPLFRALSHRSAQRPRLDNGELEALPFLNGGLFDLPLAYGIANPPTDERIRVSNEALYPVFEDFLERYNFTTTEDSPLDVEVAIDPEVIGTIFETFVLTSENEPQTNAPDRRKATGSFYTPRVVVHFICRAVLRRYLAERAGVDEQVVKHLIEFLPAEQLTQEQEHELQHLVTPEEARRLKEAALQVRACDPAVGSGAFLVGLLQEIVKLVTLLDLQARGREYVQRQNYAYDLKKQVIESCLYGVDIQEQAIQICELRLWLSLVVDYETDPALPLHQRIREIEPLPNLTFRVRVGDSLLDQLFGRDWELTSAVHDETVQRLRELKRSYFGFQSPEGKRELEMQILGLQLRLMERRLELEKQTTGADLPLLAGLITARQRRELEAAQQRLAEIEELLVRCREAQRLAALPSRDTWEHARRFDAVRDQVGVSFVWGLDFAEVFHPQDSNGDRRAPGFDIIVGNPPFVTARDADLRERYRHCWPTSCYKKYHMLAPFTELALLKLLRPQGQLGYIVSNAFATRDFGRPLVEEVFTRMELLNVVDCSGLMFPGHGTPTCVLLGHAILGNQSRASQGRHFIPGSPDAGTLLCGTRIGMGQLREEPEETALWQEIEAGWEIPKYSGIRVETAKLDTNTIRFHPWSLNATGSQLKPKMEATGDLLRKALMDDVGVATMTNCDEVFTGRADVFRRAEVGREYLGRFTEGEDVRDWSVTDNMLVLIPYSNDGDCLPVNTLKSGVLEYLEKMREPIEARRGMVIDAGRRAGHPWYVMEHHGDKYKRDSLVYLPFIATHFHAHATSKGRIYTRTAQVTSPKLSIMPEWLLLTSLNSSAALFWLKQVCFCKRYSGNPETDDYYEFAGGKVQQLPVPTTLLEAPPVKDRASTLARRCSDLGAVVPGLHPRKLFEQPKEAYIDWCRGIAGYQQTHSDLPLDWDSPDELRVAWQSALEEMRRLRRQMVALQEEMDWLMYGAYGLLPLDHPAVNLNGAEEPMPVDQLDRPYRLVQHERPVPTDWPQLQQELWRVRLEAIAEDPHIGQVEHPAYKRRWDEPFGDRDFLQAYEWWLREKAEWLLEHRHGGGPVQLEAWAEELRHDPRVSAAYEAALEIGDRLGDSQYQNDRRRGDFARHLRRIIEEETVPDQRSAFRKKHEKFRGIDARKHLPNGVPRERFRSLTDRDGWYVWAGKDLWDGVTGDVWDA